MQERSEKIRFLKNYPVLMAKITRLKEMTKMYPQNKEEYERAIRQTERCIKKTEKIIESVDGGILTEILYQKYLCGKNFETISYQLNYSKRQIERLHIIALEKLEIF